MVAVHYGGGKKPDPWRSTCALRARPIFWPPPSETMPKHALTETDLTGLVVRYALPPVATRLPSPANSTPSCAPAARSRSASARRSHHSSDFYKRLDWACEEIQLI